MVIYFSTTQKHYNFVVLIIKRFYMYRLYLIILSAILCVSCNKKYKIEGVSSLSSQDGKMLYIKVISGDKLVNIDSAEVVHGLFKMQGKVDSTMIGMLYMADESIMPLVIEKGKIKIDINNSGVTIKGTPLNEKFNDFVVKKNSLDDQAYEVERLESRMIMDGKNPLEIQQEITAQRKALSGKMDSLAINFIEDNYENVLGPGLFIMICNGLPYPVLTPMMEQILKNAPESFKNNPLIKNYVTVARANMEKLQNAN